MALWRLPVRSTIFTSWFILIVMVSLKSILNEVFVNEGVRDPSTFKAIFMAGGTGSGKTFVAKNLGLDAFGLKNVNPDEAYEFLIKRAGHEVQDFDVGSEKGQELRKRSADLTNKRFGLVPGSEGLGYLAGRLGLLIDGTGKDFEKIKGLKSKLESIGYETAMVFVNADLPTALQRNANRTRKVPDPMAKEFWEKAQQNIGRYQNLFGSNFYVVDNSEATKDSLMSELNSVYRKLRSWLMTSPRSPEARKWLEKTP